MRTLSISKCKSLFLITALLAQMFVLPQTARATVVVMVGQPNIWSLEQAHYLLAQIRERNLSLRNKSLDESDLDPNAINATQLDAYRSLFEVGVSFDQGLGLKNSLNRQNLEFNQTRRQELFARRSALFDQKSNLLTDSGRLNGELSALDETEANEEAIKEKKREIRANEQQIKAVDQRIESLNKELEVIGAGSSELSSPEKTGAPSPLTGMNERIGKSVTDEIAKAANQNSRLAASAKLDNYIQMQYELLAKQLTLLRDEVSPRERLLFLELPTSIYATPGIDDETSVQSFWKVTGYYRDNKYAKQRQMLASQAQALHAALVSNRLTEGVIEQLRFQRAYDTQMREINNEMVRAERDFYAERSEAFAEGVQYPFATPDSTDTTLQGANAVTNNCRVIDLIPRQSSLNVNDIKEVVKERGFKALFSLLIGIGGSVNYQQRRDHFEQFQKQEVYAAGFGKGRDEFGWTFNPAPGTKRLMPGIRTTYAVVVVPREATRIQLTAGAHPFPTEENARSTMRNVDKTFEIEVPNGPNNEGFFVTRIDYHNVKINTPSVVILRGNFSNQTGVLIEGTPLSRTVGLASPFFGSEQGTSVPAFGTPDTTVKGHYEIINSNQMILSFLMPAGFIGTPKITLISPNRARTLNDLRLNINGTPYRRLDQEEYRVGSKPDDPKTPLSILDVQISPVIATPGTRPQPTAAATEVNLTLAGKKNVPDPVLIYFNATACTATAATKNPCTLQKLTERLYHLQFDLPYHLEKISFTVIQKEELNTKQLDNPIFLRAVVARLSYDVGDEEDGDDDVVTIVLEGKRVEHLGAVSDTADVQWQSQSFNQAILLVSRLTPGQNVIRITDSVTGAALAPIAIKKRPPKVKKPAKENGND